MNFVDPTGHFFIAAGAITLGVMIFGALFSGCTLSEEETKKLPDKNKSLGDKAVTGAEHGLTTTSWFVDNKTLQEVCDGLDCLNIISGTCDMITIIELSNYSKSNHKKNIEAIIRMHEEAKMGYEEIANTMDLYPVITSYFCSAKNYRTEIALMAQTGIYAETGTYFKGIELLTLAAGKRGISIASSVCSLGTSGALSVYYEVLGLLSDGLNEFDYKLIYGQMGVN